MRVVIFSGTTEGRLLSYALAELGGDVEVFVATEYGTETQGKAPGIRVHTGRLTAAEMQARLAGADLCVDATHPYAVAATANIKASAQAAGIVYRRLLRGASTLSSNAVLVQNAAASCAFLAKTTGNILLTTGAKELSAFSSLDAARLYPRVLPSHESIAACEKAGIAHRNIIAMQGPYSQALNEALLKQCSIQYMVTKDGGAAGGFKEKAAAAEAAGVSLVVIRRPDEGGAEYEAILSECREWMKCK